MYMFGRGRTGIQSKEDSEKGRGCAGSDRHMRWCFAAGAGSRRAYVIEHKTGRGEGQQAKEKCHVLMQITVGPWCYSWFVRIVDCCGVL